MIGAEKDRLVSTAVLRARLEQLHQTNAEHARAGMPESAIRRSEWLLAEFEDALKEAAREYRPTGEVAALTGWDPQTLRAKARRVLAGQYPGEGWGELLVRHEAGEYTFCVATVPVKKTGELKRVG